MHTPRAAGSSPAALLTALAPGRVTVPPLAERREDIPALAEFFLTEKAKWNAIVDEINHVSVELQRPVLVGTTSVDKSEMLGQLLDKRHGIDHEVLNAKQHEREAIVVQHAGRPGAITIATNMAGRGTDIVLGGNLDAEIAAAGEGTDAGACKRARLRTGLTPCRERHRRDAEQHHESDMQTGA